MTPSTTTIFSTASKNCVKSGSPTPCLPAKEWKSRSRRQPEARRLRILEKIARFAAIALAVLFICVSVVGIFSAWFVSRKASDIALKGFGVIEIGVGAVDAGVGRVDDLIATSRTEVRQAAETIKTVGAQAVSNSPVLNALNERLDTSLAPRIAQMRDNLAPVRGAVAKIDNAVSFLSSFPMLAERAPRLATLDESFDRLEALSVDATQLRSTLRELANARTTDIALKVRIEKKKSRLLF